MRDRAALVDHLLKERPSPAEAWSAICAELEALVRAPRAPADEAFAVNQWDEVLGERFPDAARIAPTEWFARVDRAEPTSYDDYPGNTTFRDLLASPHPAWPVVRQANLCFDHALGDRDLDALARAEHFRLITGVDITCSGMSDADVLRRLLSSECLSGVERLGVFRLDLSGARAAIFAASPMARRLSAFRSGWNDLRGAELRSILASFDPKRLRVFRLERERCLGREGARELAASPILGSLTKLVLHGIQLGLDGARSLAEASTPTRLEELDLEDGGFDGGEMGRDGAEALGRSSLLAGLRRLRIGYHDIGPEGLGALLAAPGITSLESLEILCSALGDEGAHVIAASTHLSCLRSLKLMSNGIGPDGKAALVAAPHLRDSTIHVSD